MSCGQLENELKLFDSVILATKKILTAALYLFAMHLKAKIQLRTFRHSKMQSRDNLVLFSHFLCLFLFDIRKWMPSIHNLLSRFRNKISVSIKLIFSANQHFCWAHADSFLTLPLLSMPKLLIFWRHADTLKS